VASLALAFDILARDNASKTFRNVGDAAEKAGKQGHQAGALIGNGMKLAAGALLGGGLIAGFRALYDAAAESQRIGRLTTQVIQSTGGAAGVSAKQVSDLANAIARKTGVDDEAIQSGENLLLTFTNIRNEAGKGNDVFSQATSIITDMSVALGQDMKSSAIQVGKALNDPIKGVTALQRVGVSFTASQKEQIATLVESGRTMEAQKLILSELTKEFGGAAEAAATPFDKLKVTLGNLAEDLGGRLVPVVDALANFLMNDLIPAAQGLGPAFDLGLDVLKGVASAAGTVLGFFKDLPAPLQIAAVAAGAWAVAGDRILGALKPLGSMLGGLRGVFSNFTTDLAYARDNGYGAALALKEVGVRAGGQTLSAIKNLAHAIGPELAIAAAAFVVTEFVSGIQSLTQASDEAKAAAEGLAGSLTLVDRAADRSAVRGAIEDVDGLVEVLDRAGVSSQDAINGLLGQEDAQNRVTHALEVYMATQRTAQTGGNAADVRKALLAYEELATGYGNAAGAARFFGEESNGAAAGAAASGDAAAETVPQFDEAAAAVERWKQQLQSVSESFVDPLNTYKQMLDEKTQAEQAQAQATADATASGKDSWRDYVGEVTVSLNAYADRLQGQISAQENWRTNLVTIAQRGGADVAQILAQMGQDGVTLTAQMADGTDAEFQRMADLLRRDAQLGGQGATDELDKAMTIMAEVGREGAAATAQGVAQQLGLGVAEVRRIAAQYGIDLAAGINPILQGLGKAHIAFTTRAGFNAGGGLWAGGYTGDGGKYTPMGIVHGGEFVFTKEQTAKAGKSTLAVWAKMLDGYAGGGFVSTGQVPHPRSTAPYQFPISTPGDATMQREYSETVSWVAAQAAARAAAAAARAAVSGIFGAAPAASGSNQAIVQQLAASMYGWTGAQWSALYSLVMSESGFRNTAQNPTSTAYGMFQFLDSTWAGYGVGKTSDPRLQTVAGLRYIASRYGTPANAWAFHLAHNWYDDGGWLPPGVSIAVNGTGKPERVMGPGESALERPLDLSDRTIDRLAVAMIRGAGAAISTSSYRQGVNARSS
jgi:hypothetical protein